MIPILDLTIWHYFAIIILGIIASIINIMAGGGSNLILPVLMMFGIPPEIANGSNRVGIFLQSLTGIRGFAKAKKMPPRQEALPIIIPTLLGGGVGALMAAWLPSSILKPALLLAMLAVAAIVLFKPQWFDGTSNTPPRPLTPLSWFALFGTGIYGGFVQAGTGLLMLPVFAALLGYDLVRGNALKLLCTFAFTTVSLIIFILHGQIWWGIGLTLALGNIIGAQIGVKLALNIPAQAMRWLIFIMTLVAVLLALNPL